MKENGKVWKYKAIVVIVIMLVFMGSIMLLIGMKQHPKVVYPSGRLVLLEGTSGQTVTNTIIIDLVPDGSRIDVLNISGRLYFWQFNRTSLLYEDLNVSDSGYKYLSVSIGLNGTDNKTYIGNFANMCVIANIFNCDVFPITTNTELKLYFTYAFPAEGCSCNNRDYQYIFRPEFRKGYIV